MTNLKESIEQAKQKILSAKTIAVAGHINPDGDSIGSLLSLGLALELLNKQVYFISKGGVPQMYRFLPGAHRIIHGIDKDVDLAVAVDCGTNKLLGNMWKIFQRAKMTLEIDHHQFRESFAGISIVDEKAGAVGELIYKLICALKIPVNEDIAKNILTSIIVETRSFRLPNIRPFTFEVCAKMLETGLDFHQFVKTLYWSKTKELTIITGIGMARAKFIKEGRIVWSLLRMRDINKAGGKKEDADGAIEEIRAINNVDIAIFFREENKKLLKVSLRSKGDINVAAVAEKYNGGGHFDAAGCFIPNKSKAIKELLRDAESFL